MLGPLLFLTSVNNSSDKIGSNSKPFADDTSDLWEKNLKQNNYLSSSIEKRF